MNSLKNIATSLFCFLLTTICIAQNNTLSDLEIVGAMKDVMWKGELNAKIHLDTIQNRTGLYGIGPLSHLRGEIMILDGKSYISKVVDKSVQSVAENYDVGAPFFVYAHVNEWRQTEVPADVQDIQDLEEFIISKTNKYKKPFTFILKGKVKDASIHIQNLPVGSKVTSPKEAHQGQVSYKIENKEVDILGFFSETHQGVFTHHDSFLHMHLITADRRMMGHLDNLEIEKLKLFLPVR